jgi:hypothetical protein
MNEQNRLQVIKKIDQEIYDFQTKMFDQEIDLNTKFLNETETRVRFGRNKWKKIWKSLRLFGAPFSSFHDQVDKEYRSDKRFFDKNVNTKNIYQKKIANLVTEEGSRPFLKIRLFDLPKETSYYESFFSQQK